MLGQWQLVGQGTGCLPQKGITAVSASSQPKALQSILWLHPESSQVFFVFNLFCDGNFALVITPRAEGYDVCSHRCSRVHMILILRHVSDNFIFLWEVEKSNTPSPLIGLCSNTPPSWVSVFTSLKWPGAER